MIPDPSPERPRRWVWAAGEGRYWAVLAVLIVAYVGVMFRAQIGKLGALEMGFDLALEEQVLWNTAHGRFLATSTLERTDIDLGRDVIPLQLLLVVPYRLFPSPYTILFLQTLAVGLAVIPLYVLARYKLGPGAAVALALGFLGYVPLHFLSLHEFQPRAFALGPLFAAFYFLERERRLGFVVALAACLATRSDVAMVVAMIGVYALLRRKPSFFGSLGLALGAGWFLLALFVVVPHFNRGGHFQYFSLYANLGSSPAEAAKNVLTRPALLLKTAATPQKEEFLDRIYGPLAFLPWLRPEGLLVAAPNLALSLLGSETALSDIRYQYGTMLYGTAFVGTVYALAMLAGTPGSERRKRRPGLLGGALGILVGANLLMHLAWPVPTWRYLTLAVPTPRARWAEGIVRKIPADARVAACSGVAPRLAQREYLYLFPPAPLAFYNDRGLREADYIVADSIGGAYDARVTQLRTNLAFEKVAERERFVLYRRRSFVERQPAAAPDSP
jgi:uncharacterized membrane protein